MQASVATLFKCLKESTQLRRVVSLGLCLAFLFLCGTDFVLAQDRRLALAGPGQNTNLAQEAAEQNLTVPVLEDTDVYAHSPAQDTGNNGVSGDNGDPNEWDPDIPYSPTWDDKTFDLPTFLANPGFYFSKWIKQFLREVIRPFARRLTSLLLVFVLNPNIAADGLRHAKTDVQLLFNQTADVLFYISIDLSLIFFVIAIWRHWSDSAWRGRSGSWMSAVGRLIFTIALLILWKTLYTLELDITNEMIKAVWFNDPAQKELLVAAIEKIFAAALGGLSGITLASFAPFMGALGGSIMGGAPGMIIGGAGGTLLALVGWLLFIVFGVVVITEIVYFLVLKAIQEALLAAQFLFGYIFLVCFASPDTEHMAAGFVRSFIEVSLWSFVWLLLLKVLVIVLNSSDNPTGAQILLLIGVLQIMIQVPSFMGRAQISPMSEFLTAGAVTGLVSKGLSSATDSIKKVVTDMSDYQLNAKYAAVGTPETSTTSLKMPSQVDEQKTYHEHRAATQPIKITPPMSSSASNQAQNSSKDESNTPATVVASTPAVVPAAQDANAAVPTPPSKPLVNAASNGAPGSVPPSASSKTAPAAAGAADVGSGNSTLTAPASAGTDESSTQIPPPLDTTGETIASTVPAPAISPADATTAPTVAASSDAPGTVGPPPRSKGLYRTLSRVYTNARIRPWVQDLNDGENQARFGNTEEAKIHMTDRGSRMIEYGSGAEEEEMGLTVAVAGMASDLVNNPRARDASRQAVMSRHLDGPQTLAEHVGAAALYTAKGQYFSQTKLGQSRGKLGMLDETAAGTAHYITRGKAGHQNEITDQLEEVFGEYTPTRQAATVGQMTDEDSSESGLNRGTGMATRTLVSSGLQINDLSRAVFEGHLVAGQRIGQRHMGMGMVKYVEALAGKHGSQMGNHEAQPLVDAVTPQEAVACMVIARAAGDEACQNVPLVQAVASMGQGTKQESYEQGLSALNNQLSRSGANVAGIGAAPAAAVAQALQNVQQLHRAGFNDNHLANPEIVDIEDNLRQQAGGGITSPALVQAVMGSEAYAADKSISPAHLAEQVLKRSGVQSNQRSRDVVVQMMDEGFDPADIDQENIQVAEKIMDHGGGHPTPGFVQMVQQSANYSAGSDQRLSNSTVARGLVGNAAGSTTHSPSERVGAARTLLDNHVAPQLIDNHMIEAAAAMRQNGVAPRAMNQPTMVAARQLLINTGEPELLDLDNLNAAKYVEHEHLNKESVQAARHIIDEAGPDWRGELSNEELHVGKGLVASNIRPAPEVIQSVMAHPEYQAQAYAEGFTPPTAKAQVPQNVVDDFGWYSIDSTPPPFHRH